MELLDRDEKKGQVPCPALADPMQEKRKGRPDPRYVNALVYWGSRP
ncbi:hypothetical protein BSG1_12616 [Bacillus sp. SG-1]|nr:hypothetical protein BSG1_12616 [Bacillus sp. SG-1]